MQYILFHNSFDKIAGTERVLYNIAEHLSENKENTVTLLLTGKETELVLNIDKLRVDICFLNTVTEGGSGFLNDFSYYYKLYKNVLKYLKSKSENVKYVCIATNPILAFISYLAAKKILPNSLSVVSCEHFSIDVAGRLSKYIRQLFYKNVAVVALTERDREVIESRYHPKLCVCIPNAIPFELKSYVYSDSKKTILAIGRLTSQKGFDLLIRSFALVAKEHKDWELKIIGDDYGDKEALNELIVQNELVNVSILPATADIHKYYEEAAFYILSSRFEGLPMVLLEAMGYGLPIVAFNCPTGPAELVDESNGFLVENGDLSEMANAAALLMNDKQLLLEKSNGSEKRAKKYTKNNINSIWDQFFIKLDNHEK